MQNIAYSSQDNNPSIIEGYNDFEVDYSRALHWAAGDSGLPPLARLLIHVIATCMPKDGSGCYPSIRFLSKRTGISPSTVDRLIPKIKAWAKLVIVSGKGRRPSTYSCKIPKQEALGEWLNKQCEKIQPKSVVTSISDVTTMSSDVTHDVTTASDVTDDVTTILPPVVTSNDSVVTSLVTCNSIDSLSNKNNARDPESLLPHWNGRGYILDVKRDIFIQAKTVEEWRQKFKRLDVKSQVESLAAFLIGKPTHWGWGCPEGWMVGRLEETDQKRKPKEGFYAHDGVYRG